MNTKTSVIVSAILLLAMVLAGVLLWDRLPEPMASHWNEQDQVNGTMGKFWGVFFTPVMCAGLGLLLFAIPAIDPLKANIARFRGIYNLFVVMLIFFMAYMDGLVLAWNLGYSGFRMSTALLPALGLLFILTGVMIRKAKRNFFIGIRTPWTLSNDVVWEKTHRLGSVLFIISGVLTLMGVFFPQAAFAILLASVLGSAFISVVYSYLCYRQLKL